MERQQASEDLVQAGKQLVKAGLIARTWGNLSARIGRTDFVITPSGRAYDTLTPSEIVTAKIADGSYRGENKPSSEKGIHAAVYRHRPEIGFIVHTHQTNASVLSTLRRDIAGIDPAAAAVLGSSRIPCASYGLPGTKKLRRGVVEALSRSQGKAFLIASHGALCLGEDRSEAFNVATELERLSAALIMHRYLRESGHKRADWDGLRAAYLRALSSADPSFFASGPAVQPLYSSERAGGQFKLYLNGAPGDPFLEDEQSWLRVSLERPLEDNATIPPEAEIHRKIYRGFKGIRAIIHAASPDILAVSRTGRTVYPLLDDFAQIIGVNARVAAGSPPLQAATLIARRLRGRYAVMIEGNGALCCGPSRSDAAAAAQVLDKGCRAVIGSHFFGGARPIHPVEALLMRLVYLMAYSRKAVG
ncbi:MAG: hypothetical protein GYA86_02035 [Firmicutes bacterium]|nr:hypothetical protein [Bacillota bacterium]